jgi:hypothetical protein
MPGIGLVILGAVQHAPQFGRQFMLLFAVKFHYTIGIEKK